MGILNWYLDKRRDKQAGEEFRDFYGELQNQQNFQQGVVEPATRGVGILPGINSLTAGADTGAVPIDPAGGGARDIMNRGGNITPPSMDLLKHPVYGQIARELFMETVKNNPAILAAKNRQELQQEIQKAILAATGKKVDQNLLGLDELESTFRDPSRLPRDRILQNLGEREFTETTGGETAREPFRQKRFQERLNLKQTPTYKQLQGGGGEKPKKPKTATSTDINAIRRFVSERDDTATPVLTVSDFDPVSGKPTTNLSETGNTVENRAIEILETERINPKAAVNKAFAEYKRDISRKTKEVRTEQAPNASKFVEFDQQTSAAPVAPAPEQRAAEVQNKRTPAEIRKGIAKARADKKTPQEIRRMIEEEGYDPGEFDY